MKPGQVTMRYPAGDPENGPAYRQRYLGGDKWECEECRPVYDEDAECDVCDNCYRLMRRGQ